MALAKYLEDILDRFYADIKESKGEPSLTDEASLRRRVDAYQRTMLDLQCRVEELLELVTDPGFQPAAEIDYQRRHATALESLVSAQAYRLAELSAELQRLKHQGALVRENNANIAQIPGERGLKNRVLLPYRRTLQVDELRRVAALQTLLGTVFAEPGLILAALTHQSYLNEHSSACHSDQRILASVGSRVLSLCLSVCLLDEFPKAEQDTLSAMERSLTNDETVAAMAAEVGLQGWMLVERGLQMGQLSRSMLATTTRAVFGAIYLDAGFYSAREAVTRWYGSRLDFGKQIERAGIEAIWHDPKSRLQEYSQKHHGAFPEYSTRKVGSDHSPEFISYVAIGGKPVGEGRGQNKRAAEKQAAQAALLHLGVRSTTGTR